MSKYKIRDLDWTSVVFVVGFHVATIVAVVHVDISTRLFLIGLASYLLRMWAITAGYHRYFAHRSFKTSRAFQLALAIIGTLAIERGPLWWGALHRRHHANADQDDDIHSPTLHGFLWAYIGWMHARLHTTATDYAMMRDFERFPELHWLNEHYIVPPVIAAAVLFTFCSLPTFVWAVLVATVAQWHALFLSNTFCHLFGSRRFETNDTSVNNAVCAVFVLGEGWHNNHHFYPAAARQGFFWWEYDPSYWSIKLLQALRVVWDVREVPDRILLQARGAQSSPNATV